MKNLDNLFNNIRYSQALFIFDLVKELEPKVANKVLTSKICDISRVSREEGGSALKALSIAEIITYETVPGKYTSVTIIDEPMFNEIKERGKQHGK